MDSEHSFRTGMCSSGKRKPVGTAKVHHRICPLTVSAPAGYYTQQTIRHGFAGKLVNQERKFK
jgi:hypothetical protein